MDQAVSGTLLPLRDKGIRTLVLGCTHYPFMASAISAYMGSSVRLVDPAYQMASIVADALRRDALLHDGGGEISGARGYWCSGDTEAFKAVAEHLLGCPLGNVGKQAFR
jgi:glutamate racemase